MDIITVCRTLNEERNIERFCREYSHISDAILIVDGGSQDRTVEIALGFQKVLVAGYLDRVYRDNVWRNPHGLHLNRMFEWAKNLGAEWIIYDDCDSLPNYHLKENLYIHTSNPDCYMVGVRRLYLYKDEGYFPALNTPNGFAKWAWRTSLPVVADETDPWQHTMKFPKQDKKNPYWLQTMEFPSCLLHYSFPDDVEIQRKKKFYTVAKKIPKHGDWNPMQFGGEVKPLPEFAVLYKPTTVEEKPAPAPEPAPVPEPEPYPDYPESV